MKMKSCKTCGQMIAKNARVCPNCGQKYSRIGGCFAFVIIFFAVSFMIGYVINNLSNKKSEPLNLNSNQNTVTKKEKPTKEFVDAALKKMRTQIDDIKGITWYYDKSTPKYDNTNNIHLYIGQEKTGNPWLRLRIRYSSSDWLFIESYNIKADSSVFTISTSYGDVERDNSSGSIWEWYDSNVDNNILVIVNSLIDAKNVKIRYNGQKYYNEKTVSQKEKRALKNVLDAYVALGG